MKAYITQRLKKVDLHPTDVRSYRPICNLSDIGIVGEPRGVTASFRSQLSTGHPPSLQLVCPVHHSTNTADTVLDIGSGGLSFQLLLDLSAAFDTVDHVAPDIDT